MFSDLREEETDGGAENAVVEVEEQVEESDGRLVLSLVQGEEGPLDSVGRSSTSLLTDAGGAESVVMAWRALPPSTSSRKMEMRAPVLLAAEIRCTNQRDSIRKGSM